MKKLVVLFVAITFLATFSLMGCTQSGPAPEKGATGAAGATGATGAPGAAGAPGAPAPAPAKQQTREAAEALRPLAGSAAYL